MIYDGHTIIAGKAWINSSQDHGQISELMTDSKFEDGQHVADRWCAHFNPFRCIGSIALNEVKKFSTGKGIENLTNDAVAFQQFLEPHDKSCFQITFFDKDDVDRILLVSAI